MKPVGFMNHIKLNAFKDVLNSIDEKELVDVLEKFGQKMVGVGVTDYLDMVRRKLGLIVLEINKRIGGMNG